MSFSKSAANAVLKMLFQGASMPINGEQVEVNMHTDDPGASGLTRARVATFDGYAAVQTERDAGAWSVDGNELTNAQMIKFPACTGGENAIRYLSLSVGGTLIQRMRLKPTINVSKMVRVEFEPGAIRFALGTDIHDVGDSAPVAPTAEEI